MRRRLLACALFFCVPLSVMASEPAAQHAPGSVQPTNAPATLSDLFAALSSVPGVEARFVEERHMAETLAPHTSEGVLYFMPPGYLRRDLISPMASVLLLTPSELPVGGNAVGGDAVGGNALGGDAQQFSDALVFSRVLGLLFSGNHAELTATFELEYGLGEHGACDVAAECWTLTLRPAVTPLADVIGAVVVLGRGARVSEVRVYETAGDTTVTRVTEMDADRVFCASERAGVFGVTPG